MDAKFVKEFELDSGFRIGVKPLPPYYMDPIEDAYPLKDMPTYQIELASGDVYDEEYEIPDDPPSPEDEDYELYIAALHVVKFNRKQRTRRNRAKQDLLLSMCTEILEGPMRWEEDEWVERLQAPFEDFQVPEHPGKRRLLFLKMVVVTTTQIVNDVISAATFQEVTEQEVTSALQGFWSDVERGVAA